MNKEAQKQKGTYAYELKFFAKICQNWFIIPQKCRFCYAIIGLHETFRVCLGMQFEWRLVNVYKKFHFLWSCL